MAKSINSAIKQAAIGVRIGRIFKYMGSINPIPPKIFEVQMKVLIPSEYAPTHDNLGVNFSIPLNIKIGGTFLDVYQMEENPEGKLERKEQLLRNVALP